MMLAATLVLGAMVGLALVFVGTGGGTFAVPLLAFVLHLSLASSVPIALLAIGLTAVLGAGAGLLEGRVRYRAALFVGATGMALAPVGGWLAQRLPEAPLTVAFALVMGSSAVAMYRRCGTRGTQAGQGSFERNLPSISSARSGRLVWTWPCAARLGGTGMASGMLSGLLGVSGGFVIVPALTRYSDLTAQSILFTSQAVIALVSLTAVGAAIARGGMAWSIALPFAGGTVGAMLLARPFIRRISGLRVQRAFAGLSGAVALVLLTRGMAGVTT